MAILRYPSLVGIPKLDPGNLVSVLEALWDQTLKRFVMIWSTNSKPRKQQQNIDNSPSSHNSQNTKILSHIRT